MPATSVVISPAAIKEAVLLAALRVKARQHTAALNSKQENSQIEENSEWQRCARDRAYFIRTYCKIYDSDARAWIVFDLWAAQEEVLEMLKVEPKLAILKARQLGFTWLVLAWFLSEMLFSPIANVLLFSKREAEAKHLLERLTGMYAHLDQELRVRYPVGVRASTLTWSLSNGSVARAFPTNAGDSYTGTHALADEFDLVDDQGDLINAIEPTIDAGGQLILLSRVDKSRPQTEFKKIFQAARLGQNSWRGVFVPWNARPDRDVAWYESHKRDIQSRTGALDDLHEQYPASVEEAIAPNSQDKRIPGEWLLACYAECSVLPTVALAGGAPDIPGLRVYRGPTKEARDAQGQVVQEAGHYVMGADPSEGLTGSDFSPVTVVDRETGEECALLDGRFPPDVLAAHTLELSRWYNNAPVLPERNNHGHAYILALRGDNSEEDKPGVRVLRGPDHKRGWLTTAKSKADMYVTATAYLREGDCKIHSLDTFNELGSISRETLNAPDKQHDDKAVSWVLAQIARGIGVNEASGA